MTNNETDKTQLCPQCGATIPVHAGFVTWCEKCDWNVQPVEARTSDNLLASLYSRLNRRFGESLFPLITESPRLSPQVSFSKAFAFAVAGVVHLVSVGFLIVGVYLLLTGWPNIIFIAGLVLTLLAWGARPRFPKEPKNLISRGQCPEVYGLLDRISHALGGKQVHGLVVDSQFNASFFHAGWRRRRNLSIGLPLFSVLDHQEKVALVAHELAHEVNRDPLRVWLIGSAVPTIILWSTVLAPDEIWPSPGSTLLGDASLGLLVSILMVPVNTLLLGLSKMLELAAYGLLLLVFRESQRAEYRADYVASTISGAKAAVDALSKAFLGRSITVPIQKHALTDSKENVFDEIQEYVATIPDRELERIKRANTLEGARMDDTHPPTAYRIEYLKKHEISSPMIVLSKSDAEKIQLELQSFEVRVQQQLMDGYLTGIFR